MLKIIIAVFLILHGLVHGILALVPEPNVPDARFATFFSGSWLGLSESVAKPLAIILALIAMLGFIAAGLGLLDFLVPFAWWANLAVASAVISLLLLIIFWNSYVIVGVAIDVVILAILLFTNWLPE